MKLSPHWPPQHTKLGILWSGLNINLCHSRATADSQAHSRVFCGEFGTNLAKYFKPEGFYYCRPAGLWRPICSRIQIDLTEFHQRKVIQEISLFLHLCVAVLSGPVDWHWLWGIGTTYTNVSVRDHVRISELFWHTTPTHWHSHACEHIYELYCKSSILLNMYTWSQFHFDLGGLDRFIYLYFNWKHRLPSCRISCVIH